MNHTELQAWIAEYNANGGLNRQELQALHQLNASRVANGHEPVSICPHMSMAARLMAQLSVEYGGGMRNPNFTGDGHFDPFYVSEVARLTLFDPAHATSHNATETILFGSNNITWFERNSPPHWRTLMGTRLTVGIGRVGNVLVIKLM
jgi:hypothetical protein